MVRTSKWQRLVQWMSSHQAVAVVLGLLFVGIELAVYWTSGEDTVQSRMFGVAVIFLIIGLALFDNLFENSAKSQAWQQVAERTGLTYKRSNVLLGYSVAVTGIYRGRPLTLYSYKRGKGQVASTRVEMRLKSEAGASLRLRGPFDREATAADKVTGELFQASQTQLFGHNQRFFIRSKPVHVATGLFRAGPLHEKLHLLRDLTTIELDRQVLYFEQLGTLQDVDYLHFIFDLLCDLADTVEAVATLQRRSPSDNSSN